MNFVDDFGKITTQIAVDVQVLNAAQDELITSDTLAAMYCANELEFLIWTHQRLG